MTRLSRDTYARMQLDVGGQWKDQHVAGRKAYDRDSYLADVQALRSRGWTWARIARHLGISLATLHRIRRGQ